MIILLFHECRRVKQKNSTGLIAHKQWRPVGVKVVAREKQPCQSTYQPQSRRRVCVRLCVCVRVCVRAQTESHTESNKREENPGGPSTSNPPRVHSDALKRCKTAAR